MSLLSPHRPLRAACRSCILQQQQYRAASNVASPGRRSNVSNVPTAAAKRSPSQAPPHFSPPPPPGGSSSNASPQTRKGRTVLVLGGTLGLLAAGYAVWTLTENARSSLPGSRGKAAGASGSTAGLDPDVYRPLKVVRNDHSTSLMMPHERGDGLHRHIRLALPHQAAPADESADGTSPALQSVGAADDGLRIESIHIKQPQIQIERAYTPLLSRAQAEHSGHIDLLVKRYEDGEMGRYIQSQPVDGALEVRGWNTTWDEKWHAESVGRIKHVYLVSSCAGSLTQDRGSSGRSSRTSIPTQIVAGTGITPAFQLISSELNKWARDTKLTVLYAAPRPSAFLLLPELCELQRTHPDQLRVSLWAEDASSVKVKRLFWDFLPGHWMGMPIKEGRIGNGDVKQTIKKQGGMDGAVVLVCGPDG